MDGGGHMTYLAPTQAELTALFQQDLKTGVGRSVKHDSAEKHVTHVEALE